jgi:hypothetical protein
LKRNAYYLIIVEAIGLKPEFHRILSLCLLM